MTVATTTNRVSYSGDGATIIFPFTFSIFEYTDLIVILTDSDGNDTTLSLDVDYTVEGTTNGGNVTLTTAPALGETLTIIRELPITQEVDYIENDSFPAETHEEALDKATMILQQLNEKFSRALLFRVASSMSDVELPELSEGKFLYSPDGESVAWTSFFSSGEIAATKFAQTLLDDATASDMLTTLGFSTFIKTLIDDADSPTALKTMLSFLHSCEAKTADYNIVAGDRGKLISFDCTSGNLIANLPMVSTAKNGFVIALKKTDAGTNTLTIKPYTGELIDGAAGHIYGVKNSTAICVCDGTGWKAVASDLLLDGVVTTTKIADLAVTGAKIANRTVTTGKIAAGAVTEGEIVNDAVTQAKLKTSIGSITFASNANGILPGGEYGFYPQMKCNASGMALRTFITQTPFSSTSYLTCVAVEFSSGVSVNAQQRYVTSSGEVFWIFILRDKVTKEVSSMWQAPDHPCFGNGGKPLLVPHPFPDFDETKHEIIVINPTEEEVLRMKTACIMPEDTPDKDLLDVIMEEYEIDEKSNPAWPGKEVTVGLPADKDWRRESDGTPVKPIKKVIPRPSYIITKSLKKRKVI